MLAGGALTSPAHARPAAHKLDPARLGSQPVGVIRDRVVGVGVSGLKVPRPRVPAGGFEGRYPVGDGNTVRVILSEAYEPDPEVAQSVASYLGTLIHGGEIRGLTVFLGSTQDLELACGPGAEACFNADAYTTIVPAVPPASGIPQEEILAHEYGHALANGRSNYPFPAVLFGTKRWASYEQVCPRFFSVLASPEGEIPYRDHPGEAFADSYRILNGGSPSLFRFNRAYFPNATALRLIRTDALDPWHQRPPAVLRGGFSSRQPGPTRRVRVVTPLDGLLRIEITAPPGADYDLELRTPILRTPVARGMRRGRVDQIATLICGARSYTLTVRRHRGFGPYRLSISKP